MTPATKPVTRRALPAAALAALLLAGCSSGHVGESWQCPLADAGTCDSVAAADPAVPDTNAARNAALGEPLWRVQASLLAAQRLVYRLHRAGIAWGTSGSAALCARYPMPIMKKSQYRWQMTEPVPATSPMTGCNPTGRSSVLWEALRELPVAGESFGYLLWRKRTCCLL